MLKSFESSNTTSNDVTSLSPRKDQVGSLQSHWSLHSMSSRLVMYGKNSPAPEATNEVNVSMSNLKAIEHYSSKLPKKGRLICCGQSSSPVLFLTASPHASSPRTPHLGGNPWSQITKAEVSMSQARVAPKSFESQKLLGP